MLALYLHLVGTVCRDVERTVEGKILKVTSYVFFLFVWCFF